MWPLPQNPKTRVPGHLSSEYAAFLTVLLLLIVSSLLILLQSIASFSGDLSSLVAPPFILSTTSLVEYSSYWADRPSLFVAPVNEPDPAKRALSVLKWFLSTLRQRTAYRDGKVGGEKKPLNPFLGELFVGKWEDAAGTTQIVSEQVRYAHGFCM